MRIDLFNMNFTAALFNDSNRNIAFTVFGIEIYWYAIFALIGFSVCAILIRWLLKSKGHDPEMALDMILIALPLAILGARLWYVIFGGVPLSEFFNIRDGGLAWHGGVTLVTIGLIVYAYFKKVNIFVLLDVCAVVISIGMAFGRFGNQINGELYGDLIAEGSPFRFYPFALKARGSSNYYVNIPFYEQLCCLAIFAGTLIWYKKNPASRPGLVMPFYLIGYGIARAILEPLRAPQFQMPSHISIITSVVMVVIGIAMFAYFAYIYYYKKKEVVFTSKAKENIAESENSVNQAKIDNAADLSKPAASEQKANKETKNE